MKLDPKETAVLVIDIQNDYWMPPRLPRQSFIAIVKELLSFSREKGVEIIYIKL